MKNIRKFETTAEMESAVLTEPYVLYNEETGLVYTNHNGGSNDNEVDYSAEYLTFEAIEDSTFKLTQSTCQYSLDEGETWVNLPVNTETSTVSAGNKIMFKCTNPSTSLDYGMGTFSSSGKFNVSGNIMSMLYGDDFVDKTDLTGKYHAFRELFSYCTNVVEANNLILPATTLDYSCYNSMFKGCSSLVNAPELPATTLGDGFACYNSMFSGCTSLTTAPSILPATELVDDCYGYMFNGCTSLTTAPILPATELGFYCYESMFEGCTNLSEITMLATEIWADDCLLDWVSGVASTGTFYKNPDMDSLPTGTSGIPNGWTVEDAVL